MSKEFDSIIQGLTEALEYAKGDISKGISRTREVASIDPVREYSKDRIKELRVEANMSQKKFAEVFGVSPKAIEAWEQGIRKPAGSARRLFQLIEEDKNILDRIKIK